MSAAPAAPVQPAEPFIVLGERQNAPLVIFCHGATETERAITDGDPNAPAIAKALVARGYEVAASRAHGNNWGSAQSVQDYLELYAYLQATDHPTALFVLGQSMGALDCLQLATRLPVRAFYGIYPLTDVRAVTIGGVLPAELARQRAANLTMTYSGDTTYRFAASYADTVVPRSQNSDISAQATNGTELTCQGEHGDASCFNAQDILEFFAPTRTAF